MFLHPRKPTTRPPILPWLLFVGLAIPRVWTAFVNRTIDDTYGDPATGQNPTFSPSGWFTDFCAVLGGTFSADCNDWAPNNTYTFDHTYHFTYSSNDFLSLEFIGTAIYVYTIAINSTQDGIGPELPFGFGGTGFTAELDGGRRETGQVDLTQLPILPAYNVLLYSKTGLENITHSLTISPLDSQLLFFDYAVYSFEESDSASSSSLAPTLASSTATSLESAPSSSSPSEAGGSSAPIVAAVQKKQLAGPIAGGVIGGLILLTALGVLFFCVRRRRRQTANPDFVGHADEKRPAPWPAHPIPRNFTPDVGFMYEGWEPETWSDAAVTPRGEARLSPIEPPVPVSPQTSASEEKNALYLARQEEAGRQVELLRQQIRDLTEQARPSLPSESMNTSVPRQNPDWHTNAQLVAQIRTLTEQIDIIQNEMEISEPPEYMAHLVPSA